MAERYAWPPRAAIHSRSWGSAGVLVFVGWDANSFVIQERPSSRETAPRVPWAAWLVARYQVPVMASMATSHSPPGNIGGNGLWRVHVRPPSVELAAEAARKYVLCWHVM